uniref:HDC09404 n=1 Tax=Drosophila melanogaster TaxID=7227 RepID=Q6ILI4_DROME|nr:TPA_inf: HDC09404 [Drosophila melanogaster]
MKLRLTQCTVATVCIKCSGAVGHLSTGEVDKILTKQTSKAGKSLFQSGIEPRTVCEIYANLCQTILCPPSLQFRRDTLGVTELQRPCSGAITWFLSPSSGAITWPDWSYPPNEPQLAEVVNSWHGLSQWPTAAMPRIRRNGKKGNQGEVQTTVEHEVPGDMAAGSCSDLDHGIHCHAPKSRGPARAIKNMLMLI